MPSIVKGVVAIAGASLLASCAANPASQMAGAETSTPSSPRTVIVSERPGVPRDLHWFRNSAERKVIYAQSYRFAWRLVEDRLPTLTPGKWSVILDIDETILDNSEFQARQAITGLPFDDHLWTDWTKERRAVAFPPARDFINKVRDHGGHIVLVTDRDESQCSDTRETLSNQAIAFDVVLCATTRPPSKESRFADVKVGKAIPAVGPQEVILYLGDNIKDCQGQTQANFDPELFGTRCIALPNPMYGSWIGNIYK